MSSRFSDRFKWSAKPFNPPGDFTDPVKIFNDFFDNGVIQMIVTYSELYARSTDKNTFSSTPDEMRAFLWVLLVLDYSPEPRRYLHWTGHRLCLHKKPI